MKNLPIINLIAFILMAFINFLAANRIITTNNPGDVSHFYDNMFTPADYAFSIWSFIYLAVGLFVWNSFQNRKQPISAETKKWAIFLPLPVC